MGFSVKQYLRENPFSFLLSKLIENVLLTMNIFNVIVITKRLSFTFIGDMI